MYPIGYDPDKFVSNPGQQFKPEYIGEINDDGFTVLVEVGKTDLVELHQRDAFANDVNVLYQRFCNGDVTALSQVQGTFMDALGVPRDLRGMYDMVEGYRRAYEAQSDDLKRKYSFEQFLEQAGSETWLKDFVKAPDDPPKETVNKDNSDNKE